MALPGEWLTTAILLLMTYLIVGIAVCTNHAWLLCWDMFSLTFPPCWSWITKSQSLPPKKLGIQVWTIACSPKSQVVEIGSQLLFVILFLMDPFTCQLITVTNISLSKISLISSYLPLNLNLLVFCHLGFQNNYN